MIQAKVIADSINEFGHRITTLEVVMPRYILAEFNTHRMFSRNSASSRAIRFEKMVEAVFKNPFIPYAWQEDHPGMQGTKYLPSIAAMQSAEEWKIARTNAIVLAQQLHDREVTKQLCNRLLEPFMWHTVLVTATEWDNFYNLRCPQYEYEDGLHFKSRRDWLQHNFHLPEGRIKNYIPPSSDLEWLQINKGQADIHMMFTAEAIYDAIKGSRPNKLEAGEWHIPYGDYIANNSKLAKEFMAIRASHMSSAMVTELSWDSYEAAKIQIATARCARVSYVVPEAEKATHTFTKDIELHDRLMKSGHWSPFEHCAKAMSKEDLDKYIVIEDGQVQEGWCRNFNGFIQYRSLLDARK